MMIWTKCVTRMEDMKNSHKNIRRRHERKNRWPKQTREDTGKRDVKINRYEGELSSCRL
jgi:hypothetical protein